MDLAERSASASIEEASTFAQNILIRNALVKEAILEHIGATYLAESQTLGYKTNQSRILRRHAYQRGVAISTIVYQKPA